MKNFMSKLTTLLLALLAPLALVSQTGLTGDVNPKKIDNQVFTNSKEVIIVARGGDFHGTTENSREALRKTAEKKAQVALVTLKERSDGDVYLDCADDQISLSEAMELANGSMILAFNNPQKYIEGIRQAAKEADMLDAVVLYATPDPKGEIPYIAVVNLDNDNAQSALSQAVESQPLAIELDFSAFDNPLLSEAIAKVNENSRVAFNICGSEPNRAGGLSDSGRGPDGLNSVLDKLIEIGGTVIITDQIKPCMWYIHPETKQQRAMPHGPGAPQAGAPRGGRMRQADGSTMAFSKDSASLALLKETVGKFSQHEYYDSITGQTVDYHLCLPKDYDPTQKYPLVMFIGDATTVGGNVMYPLTQGWGGLIWASDESQQENPCFVLVPHFRGETPNIELPGNNPDGDAALRLMQKVIADYPAIDTNRLYKTGQSKGGMISMYLSIEHPEIFAASIFVGCQWDTQGMESYPDQKFFYIVAEGDTRACPGMAAVKAVLDSLDAPYAESQWSAKAPMAEQDANVEKMIAKGLNNNFIIFDLGTVMPPDGEGLEHMWSFDYAYRLKPVRDWLFKQSK
ncbi:MAG: hypothetical protein LUD17_12290 [Bacteroidales bacterium]|nr:hypothetical protein [Bacteroidales bacterium]